MLVARFLIVNHPQPKTAKPCGSRGFRLLPSHHDRQNQHLWTSRSRPTGGHPDSTVGSPGSSPLSLILTQRLFVPGLPSRRETNPLDLQLSGFSKEYAFAR